jgi:hypothetical protein
MTADGDFRVPLQSTSRCARTHRAMLSDGQAPLLQDARGSEAIERVFPAPIAA